MKNKAFPIPVKKVKNPLKTFRRLLKYVFSDYKIHFVVVFLCIVLSSVSSVLGSMFLRTLIDDYINPLLLANNRDFSGLLNAILTMGLIYFVGIISTYLYNLIMVIISQRTLKKIRNEMFSNMQKLPIKYFDTHTNGDVMSYYTNDTDTLRQMIAHSIPQVFSSVITVVSVFFAMIYQSIPLTFIVLAFVFIMSFAAKKITGNSAKYFIGQQKSLAKTNGYIEEMINGQKVVKTFNYEDESKKKFDLLNDDLCSNATNANKFANILMPILGNLGHLQYVFIALIGGIMAVYAVPNFTIVGVGTVTIGIISSFLTLSRSFSMPVSQISQQINAIVMALAGAERIFEHLDENHETDEGHVTLVNATTDSDGNIIESDQKTGFWAWKHPHNDNTVTYTPLQGEVTFNQVDFGYTDDTLVLHDITLYAKPGQKIAFVGSTGAGKTTITNLINRFYDIDDGKIRYDNININKIKKSDLRRSLGIVLQDTNLFTGSIKDNIRYGNLDATDDDVIEAAKLANAHDFIEMLPNGYDTVIKGDGSGLSQGQRQLISIARAAVADPPVMILDEATSSIDTRTEALVQKGMDSLMKGRTVFVIAHRLSTIRNADVIMVLEKGRIIERGNHEELLEKKGKYYQLYTGAFELE